MDTDEHRLKTKFKLFVPLLFAFLVLTQGCEQKSISSKEIEFRPLQNGFGVMVQQIGIDSGPGAKLYYKGTNETPVLVWPYIGTHGYPILYTNDIAFLLADKPDGEGRLVICSLIVVQGVGPAMDISDDVLKIAASQTNADFKKLLNVYEPLRLNQAEGKLKVTYAAKMGSGYPPGLEASITWEQVFDLMQNVKLSGKTNTVVNTDTLYLQKDYRSANVVK